MDAVWVAANSRKTAPVQKLHTYLQRPDRTSERSVRHTSNRTVGEHGGAFNPQHTPRLAAEQRWELMDPYVYTLCHVERQRTAYLEAISDNHDEQYDDDRSYAMSH